MLILPVLSNANRHTYLMFTNVLCRSKKLDRNKAFMLKYRIALAIVQRRA